MPPPCAASLDRLAGAIIADLDWMPFLARHAGLTVFSAGVASLEIPGPNPRHLFSRGRPTAPPLLSQGEGTQPQSPALKIIFPNKPVAKNPRQRPKHVPYSR